MLDGSDERCLILYENIILNSENLSKLSSGTSNALWYWLSLINCQIQKNHPLSLSHEKKQMVLFEECYLFIVKQNYNEV